jgi:hypothetical protein
VGKSPISQSGHRISEPSLGPLRREPTEYTGVSRQADHTGLCLQGFGTSTTNFCRTPLPLFAWPHLTPSSLALSLASVLKGKTRTAGGSWISEDRWLLVTKPKDFFFNVKGLI